jgi:non-ribosomal peptide synthetase component E (peptide arylation enzyme)
MTEIIKRKESCKDMMINDDVRVDEKRKISRGGTAVCNANVLGEVCLLPLIHFASSVVMQSIASNEHKCRFQLCTENATRRTVHSVI